jgi:hypothetical protein
VLVRSVLSFRSMTSNPLFQHRWVRTQGFAAVAAILVPWLLVPALPAPAVARTLVADPLAGSGQAGYYQTLVGQLAPGDTLLLPAGNYGNRLVLAGLNGTPSGWIVIQGPASGSPARITTSSTCCNTVQLDGTSYVAIRNLTIDSAGIDAIDGINAKGNPTHDILIENCTLVGQSSGQGTVAISTKSPAWRWTIRGNRIIEAGTGAYLGNSDGTQPFIAGVIEGNLFLNTIGYNMEIKYQVPYDGQGWTSQIPSGPNRTIIRDNVFIKEKNDWLPSQTAGARPNLLVDPFPDSGLGSTDLYEIYGNFFYKNPIEALFQGTGRISLHDNVFVASGSGEVSAYFTDHNGALRLAHVYNNTIYSTAGGGIIFASSARQGDAVVGNLLVTAGTPLGGSIVNSSGNLIGTVANASSYFTSPSEILGQMDFYPKSSCPGCNGAALDMSAFTGETSYDHDFNGTSKGAFVFRGAYAGQGVNPGWRLQADLKSVAPPVLDLIPPAAVRDVAGH